MIEFTEDEWNNLQGPIDVYGEDVQFLINIGDTSNKFTDKLELYCKENNLDWVYSDQIIIDDFMDIGYLYNCYTGFDEVILTSSAILGKAGFDQGAYPWTEIENEFINNPKKALPNWFPNVQLEQSGFEKQSCEFANGWYGQNDNPTEILEKSTGDIVFQVNYVNQFETGFCVWRKV